MQTIDMAARRGILALIAVVDAVFLLNALIPQG
ncbi:MAG: hypothetical protein JWR77_2013 [Rhizorhabdus sp.]|nr:hypothetical protein [Rhizorhabdus sp.]